MNEALAYIVDSLVQDSTSVDDVASERRSLELIQIALGSEYVSEMTKLNEHELALMEQQEDQAVEDDDVSPVQSGKAAIELSIDELFASLAER